MLYGACVALITPACTSHSAFALSVPGAANGSGLVEPTIATLSASRRLLRATVVASVDVAMTVMAVCMLGTTVLPERSGQFRAAVIGPLRSTTLRETMTSSTMPGSAVITPGTSVHTFTSFALSPRASSVAV